MKSGNYVMMTISSDGCAVQPENLSAYNQMIVDRLGGWTVTLNDSEFGNTHSIYFPRIVTFSGQASPQA
jgi:hypothetical protein